MFANQETGHVSVAHSVNVWVVGHTHIPLVELLVIADGGVQLANEAEQPGHLVIDHHEQMVKASPVAQASQVELIVPADMVGKGAGGARGSVPTIHTVPGVTAMVNPTLVHRITLKLATIRSDKNNEPLT